jgi:hypothetical protein
MGFADSIKSMFGRAKNAAAEHTDETKDIIDKGADKIDDMTGNKMSGGIDKGADMAKDAVDKYGKQN